MKPPLFIPEWSWRTLWILPFLFLWNNVHAQIRYTIPEELKEGSVVGNIAKDLGLDVADIANRRLRIASESGNHYFTVDLAKGELVVNDRIDREKLCGIKAICVLTLEVVVENPLQLHRIEIDVQDINDNAPDFHTKEIVLKIAESTTPGKRFPLEKASDPDVGSNSLREYTLNTNDYFRLNVKNLKDGIKVPELIVEKALDRETESSHQLVLTALDGGSPAKTGTLLLQIHVQDVNDNDPKFELATYKADVQENAKIGHTIIRLKATDLDEGPNSEIEYSFPAHNADTIKQVFRIHPDSGEITVIAALDYEECKSYTFDIIAKDKGTPELEGHSSVQIDVLDENDNAPEIILKSLPSPVTENAPKGTVVALINVKDLDSGDNGKVELNISPGYPFTLKPSFDKHYSLVTDSLLDREITPEYNVEILASDSGTPSLKTSKIIKVKVLDVNDNPPVFSQSYYNVFLNENNPAGSSLFSITATDKDQDKNAKLLYSIADSKFNDIPASSYFYINAENGTIYSMNTFDYENIKLFKITILATDQGSPSLHSNATVNVFILDQNDNIPAVIYPSAVMGSVSHQRMPRSAKTGHLVTKVTAVDADSGHNAWISYRLTESTDSSLFAVNLYTGEVRTKRSVSEQDDASQRLLIEIKDNGEPVQSTTVTVDILIEDGLHEPISDFRQKATEKDKKNSKITFYLILSLASVSVLSLLTFFILLIKCARSSRGSASCCIRGDSDGYKNPNRNLQIQLNTDGPIKYVEVLGGDMMSQSQSFGSYLSPMSEFSDLTLVKPSSTLDFKDTLRGLDASLPDSAWTFECQQQKPPNNDWRLPPNQRPGPSGAGPLPEGAGVVAGTGPWPQPPTEAEQLQALMAGANAVNEATATLGPRYNAQYVPDYRQNVYIPGSTATLTANPQQQQQPQQALPPPAAMPPVDVPKAAQTPASKKKSTKKDKK
ncbi:protocadherin gamma-C5-like isoform X26 [Alosa alosa]|uniref:protocadherin gamma-C5-like isoform X27 n=1 Tax=Alosa sapidissima TaxID=34773 RepID=UPI001C08B7E2|nr:protocadherin gamma-C5-like isoform X27 [Alosa sapidissima]XP_048088362.1 protocadherin gamma-C5-like isoform X26 [Alosa alosa]